LKLLEALLIGESWEKVIIEEQSKPSIEMDFNTLLAILNSSKIPPKFMTELNETSVVEREPFIDNSKQINIAETISNQKTDIYDKKRQVFTNKLMNDIMKTFLNDKFQSIGQSKQKCYANHSNDNFARPIKDTNDSTYNIIDYSSNGFKKQYGPTNIQEDQKLKQQYFENPKGIFYSVFFDFFTQVHCFELNF
jgi:hypothetical protein